MSPVISSTCFLYHRILSFHVESWALYWFKLLNVCHNHSTIGVMMFPVKINQLEFLFMKVVKFTMSSDFLCGTSMWSYIQTFDSLWTYKVPTVMIILFTTPKSVPWTWWLISITVILSCNMSLLSLYIFRRENNCWKGTLGTDTLMLVHYCWDLVFLRQLVEESTHGWEQESYFQGLIYLLVQVWTDAICNLQVNGKSNYPLPSVEMFYEHFRRFLWICTIFLYICL